MSQLLVDDIVDKDGGNSVGFSKGINVSASSTITGNLNVTGVITYEDVTNIDSVGIITARSGIKLGAAGVGGTIAANGDTTLAGVVTATSFSATDSITATGGIKFGAAGIGGTIRANGDTTLAGVVTATAFVGDGTGLTGMANTANVSTSTLNVVGISTLLGNVGIGTTFAQLKLHIQDGKLASAPTPNSNCDVVIEGASNTGIQFLSASQTQLRFGDADSNAAGALIYQHTDDNFKLNYKTGTGKVSLNDGGGEKAHFGTGGFTLSGICTISQGTDLDGFKVEEGKYDTDALNGEFDYEFENGHVQTHTGSTAGTYFPDFKVSSSISLDSVMDVGDVVSATLIVTASNTAHYCTTGIKIDNSTSNVTIEWIGSSAPSAGKGAGYDIYSFTIQKTAATPAYLVIVNATDAG